MLVKAVVVSLGWSAGGDMARIETNGGKSERKGEGGCTMIVALESTGK